MSTLRILAALALCSAVSVAQAGKDCNELKSEIDARIQAKGAKGYTLDVVASADAGAGAATVVGSCEGGTRKIVYTRGGAAPAPAPAAAPAAAPAPAAPAAPAAAKKSSAVQKKPVPTLGNY